MVDRDRGSACSAFCMRVRRGAGGYWWTCGGMCGLIIAFSDNSILHLSFFFSPKRCEMKWGFTVRFCGATVTMGL
jgi:hypothetical protein